MYKYAKLLKNTSSTVKKGNQSGLGWLRPDPPENCHLTVKKLPKT